MSFDANIGRTQPMIKPATSMNNDGGSSGNTGYMGRGRRQKKDDENQTIFGKGNSIDFLDLSSKLPMDEEKKYPGASRFYISLEDDLMRLVFHQLLLTVLDIHIGNAGIQIVGAHGMTACRVLLTERLTILIIISTIGHTAADVNHFLCCIEITLVASGAVNLNHRHVVRRTNGILCYFLRIVVEEVAKEIGCLHTAVV